MDWYQNEEPGPASRDFFSGVSENIISQVLKMGQYVWNADTKLPELHHRVYSVYTLPCAHDKQIGEYTTFDSIPLKPIKISFEFALRYLPESAYESIYETLKFIYLDYTKISIGQHDLTTVVLHGNKNPIPKHIHDTNRQYRTVVSYCIKVTKNSKFQNYFVFYEDDKEIIKITTNTEDNSITRFIFSGDMPHMVKPENDEGYYLFVVFDGSELLVQPRSQVEVTRFLSKI